MQLLLTSRTAGMYHHSAGVGVTRACLSMDQARVSLDRLGTSIGGWAGRVSGVSAGTLLGVYAAPVARVAAVPRVARVARVACVARVARV